jgi:uroporphyrinogen III methyltransferase / synthase
VIADLTFDSEGCGDIISLFREHGITGESILLPGSNLQDEYLVGGLQSLGNRVTPLCVYKHGVQELEQSVDFAFIDEIFFASPSCVRNFSTMFGAIPERITVTCADQPTGEEYRKVFG